MRTSFSAMPICHESYFTTNAWIPIKNGMKDTIYLVLIGCWIDKLQKLFSLLHTRLFFQEPLGKCQPGSKQQRYERLLGPFQPTARSQLEAVTQEIFNLMEVQMEISKQITKIDTKAYRGFPLHSDPDKKHSKTRHWHFEESACSLSLQSCSFE